MFVTCGIWCVADILSVSPSSEQTPCGIWCLADVSNVSPSSEQTRANARNVS